jgi:hypothetical protein
MNTINDGGPAFPTIGAPVETNGLSIRDYMAAKAMQGLCATLTGAGTPRWDLLAIEAYAMADAMLAARGQQ